MNSLYQLIHSLNRAEKKFFKLYSSKYELTRLKQEMILFETIAKTKEPSDEKIKKRIKNKQVLKQFNLYKHLLYKNLLKHLADNHLEKSTDEQIIKLLKWSKVLFQKAMYGESIRFLGKAITLAHENESFALYLHLCEVRNKIEGSSTDVERYFRDNIAGITDEMSVSEQQKNIIALRELNNKINHQIMVMGVAEDSRIKKEFSEDVLKSFKRLKDVALSNRAELLYWKSLLSVAYVNQDYKTARHYLLKIIRELEKIPGNYPDRTEQLLRVYYLLLWSYFFQGAYKKAAEAFKKADGLDVKTPNLSLLKFDLFINYEILTEIHNGKGDNSEEVEKKLLDVYSSYLGSLEIQNRLAIDLNMATLFFTEGKFQKSMEWIQRVLERHNKLQNFEIVVRAKILQIIIQYKLKYRKMLRYSILSAKRFISKKRKVTKEELLLLSAIKRLSAISDDKKSEKFEKCISNWVRGQPMGQSLEDL